MKLRKVSLTFETLPYSELYPNELRRGHWGKRSDVQGIAREEAYLLGLQEWKRQQPMELCEVEYHFVLPTKRRRDPDGLISAAKAWMDGAKDAGIIVDDDIFMMDGVGHIKRVIITGEYLKNQEKTVITFTEVANENP